MIQTIRYINHSGFLVETDKAILVFDYFTDPAEVLADLADDERPFVFFVSHAHYDHWNLGIFDFRAKEETIYVLDESCRQTMEDDKELSPEDATYFVGPRSIVEFSEDIRVLTGITSIRTFNSTDEGVSFLIRTEDDWIFHAGDLNNWDWQDEDSATMEEAYRTELAAIATALEEFRAAPQVAFVPTDQRLQETALSGALILLEYLKPNLLVPMHLNGGRDLPRMLASELSEKTELAGDTIVVPLITSGQGCDRDGNLLEEA